MKDMMEGKGEMTELSDSLQSASSLRAGTLSCLLFYVQDQKHLLNERVLSLSALTIVVVAQRNFHCRNPPLEPGSHVHCDGLVQE